jgi:hypothetical protein
MIPKNVKERRLFSRSAENQNVITLSFICKLLLIIKIMRLKINKYDRPIYKQTKYSEMNILTLFKRVNVAVMV